MDPRPSNRGDRELQQEEVNEARHPGTGLGVRLLIVSIADALHSQYPQYKGHWDGPEWKLGRINRSVTTKLGVAFEAGDVILYKDGSELGGQSFTAFSIRNNVDTVIVDSYKGRQFSRSIESL